MSREQLQYSGQGTKRNPFTPTEGNDWRPAIHAAANQVAVDGESRYVKVGKDRFSVRRNETTGQVAVKPGVAIRLSTVERTARMAVVFNASIQGI